jgi:16S rRNA (guanine966-N2)-methyltransferase
MRIIAGTCRGRRLLPPDKKSTTRPMTDRVKESLFDRLQSLGVLAAGELHGVVDVFCGTGSLGLEALSRGANHCTFVDQDRDAIARLRQNLSSLGLSGRARVHLLPALSRAWTTALTDRSLGLVFLDPPYAMTTDPAGRDRVLALLDALGAKMEPGGVLVLRTARDCPVDPRPQWDGPASFDYGTTTLHFYQRPLSAPL